MCCVVGRCGYKEYLLYGLRGDYVMEGPNLGEC